MAMMKIRIFPFYFVLPALLLLGACSANPATGKQSFTAFMSPEKEIQVGAEEHPKIVKQFGGRFGDKALAAYVRDMGIAHRDEPSLVHDRPAVVRVDPHE